MKKVKWEMLNEKELQKVEGGANRVTPITNVIVKVYKYFLKK